MPKSKLRERFAQFAQGRWTALISASREVSWQLQLPNQEGRKIWVTDGEGHQNPENPFLKMSWTTNHGHPSRWTSMGSCIT